MHGVSRQTAGHTANNYSRPHVHPEQAGTYAPQSPHSQQPPAPVMQAPLTHGRDEELAILFQQMRQITGADIPTFASHLQITPETLMHFERGEFEAFPPWAETVRIVSSIALLVNVDCEPILQRISQKNCQPGPQRVLPEQPAAVPVSQEVPRSRALPTNTSKKISRVALSPAANSLMSRKTLGLAAVPVALAVIFFAAITLDQKNSLSGPIGHYAKAGWELFNWRKSSDGLRWINVSDPRSRKANKLPIRSGTN